MFNDKIKNFVKGNNEKLECIKGNIFVSSKIVERKMFNHFGQKGKGFNTVKYRVFFTYCFISHTEYLEFIQINEDKSHKDSKFVISANYYKLMQDKINSIERV